MAAILYLDDGRPFGGSSIGVNGLLYLVADAIAAKNSQLSTWLRDKGDRPAPFQDFDLRGLSASDRAAFWEGADHALKRCEELPQAVRDTSYAVDLLRRLILEREKIVRGEPPQEPRPLFRTEDLGDLWGGS
jgi:hypothetical protein